MIPKFRAYFNDTKDLVKWEKLQTFKGLTTMFIDDEKYDSFTLMQATGLKDKNGKTYYEGDLVAYDDEIFQVKFDKYQFVLEGFYEPRQDVPYDFFSEGAYKDAEVIGNIYENPNILEGEK